MICGKNLYEANPLAYCTDKLGLCDPKIIVEKIRVDTLWEFDGAKVYLTGRTGDYYVCKHAYQLVIDREHEGYIKQISKYIERCEKAKKELEVTAHDGVDYEKNVELYGWFIQRLHAEAYARLFASITAKLEKSTEVFCGLSLYMQCKKLLEVLKLFKCDRQTSDFSELYGAGNAGVIKFSKNISGCKSVYVINQSVTGLYEYKIDLLK